MKLKNWIILLLVVIFSTVGFSQALRTIKTDVITTNASGGTVDLAADVSINSSGTVDTILDEDDLVSDSDTALATQQSIKAYVDTLTVSSIDDIGDVTVTSPSTGQVLTWSGSAWVNGAAGGAGGISAWVTSTGYLIGNTVHETNHLYLALTNHTSGTFATDLANNEWVELTDGLLGGIGDVTITTPATNDLFAYTGSVWENVSELTYVNMAVTTSATATYLEGRFFYDDDAKTYTGYNDIVGTSLQLGREERIRAYNDSGLTIADGAAVYISGVNASPLLPEIDLANSSEYLQSRLVGVVTKSCINGAECEVTRFGIVNNIDTSLLSVGALYLDSTNGVLTNTKPTSDTFVINIGFCLVSDGTVGSILVDIQSSELTVEVTDTNGFPNSEVAVTTLSFVNGTRTFTIAPTGAGFHYYDEGNKYEKSSSEDVVITDVEGVHAIYYSSDTLTSLANPTSEEESLIIRTQALVAYVLWDATNSVAVMIENERHGIGMSPQTHAYTHFTRGAQFIEGLALGTFSVDGTGDIDADAQFGSTSGKMIDEDIRTNIASVVSTVGYPIYYVEGASADLRRTTNAGFPVLDDITAGVGATGRLVYNEWTGAVWQLTTVPDNNYVLYHVFGTNSYDAVNAMISIPGQEVYGNLASARAGASTEISNILVSLSIEEVIPLGTVIYQTRNLYTNGVKARVRLTDLGENYVDWRTTELIQGVAPTDHNNLANLDLAQNTITWGHIDDQAQTIAGAKTFTDAFVGSSTGSFAGDLTLSTQLTLENDAATFSTSIKALDALAASWTLTLPPNDGDADQVLTTDGSGVTTWEDAGTSGRYLDLTTTDNLNVDRSVYEAFSHDDKSLVLSWDVTNLTNATLTTDTTNELSGTQSYLLTNVTGATAEYMSTVTVSVPKKARGKLNAVKFPYTYDGDDGDITIQVYDVTNTTLLDVAVDILASVTGNAELAVYIPLTAAEINLRVTVDTVNNGKLFVIDDVEFVDNVTNLKLISSQSIRYDGYAGYGSTNNKIPYYTNTRENTGANLVTITNSSTTGFSITAIRDCHITVTLSHSAPGNDSAVAGLSLNSTELTTAIHIITAADRVALNLLSYNTGNYFTSNSTYSGKFPAGSVIRPHTAGTTPAISAINGITVLVTADSENVIRPVSSDTWMGTQSYTLATSGTGLLDTAGEVRVNLATATIVNNGESIIVPTDDSGNTRTTFVATRDCTVVAFTSAFIATASKGVGITKNGTLLGQSVYPGANNPAGSTISFDLEEGEYFTYAVGAQLVIGGNWRNDGVSQSFGFTAFAPKPLSALIATPITTSTLNLVDGVTEPDTVAGTAQLFVDVADGDLKVKFGDGTVTVIAAD